MSMFTSTRTLTQTMDKPDDLTRSATETAVKLSNMNQRVSRFHDKMENEIEVRRVDDDTRVKMIKDAIAHLDRLIQTESRKRQGSFEDIREEVKKSADNMYLTIKEEIDTMAANFRKSLAEMGETLNNVETNLQNQIAIHNDAIAALRKEALKSLNDLETGIATENAERKKMYDQLNEKVAEGFARISAAIEKETIARERAVSAATTEALTNTKLVEKCVNEQLENVASEIRAIQEEIDREKAERKEAEDKIVNTLEDVVSKIQGGLSMVTKH